jgi:RHS repeat-associated protein
VARYDYDAFGNRITNTAPELGEDVNPFGFSTKFTDEETGHLNYGYRIYLPEMGRWPSIDPMYEIIGEMPELLPEGANLYSFVGSNPINWFDDLGLAAKEAYKIAFKGAGGVDPNGEWASFTSNVFGSRSLNSGVKAAVKYFDTDNNGKLDATDCPPFKIRVVGYSWGGWTAIKFANEMGNKVTDPNMNLRMAVGTLDPVDTLRSGSASLPAWVKSATNIYQTNGCWKGCPGARIGFRRAYAGQSVPGASNTDLTSTPHGQPGYRSTQQNYDHITIQVKAADIIRAVNNAKLD